MFHILLQIKFICGVNDSDYKGGILNNKSKLGKTKLLNKGVWCHWSMLSNQCALIFNERRGKGNSVHICRTICWGREAVPGTSLKWNIYTGYERNVSFVEDPVFKKI